MYMLGLRTDVFMYMCICIQYGAVLLQAGAGGLGGTFCICITTKINLIEIMVSYIYATYSYI